MYQCLECRSVFNEPDRKTWYEHHGEFVEPWTALVCPMCGSDDIGEVDEEWD